MSKENPWFFDERAVAFAMVVLTKHDNVKARRYAGRDMNIHLLCEILKDGKSTEPEKRYFGVQLIPYMDVPSPLERPVFSHLGRDSFEAGLPICAFVIGIRKPEGIFRWVVEPIIEDGKPTLHRDAETDWQPLDEEGVTRLIGQVNAWYDTIQEEAPPKPRGRRTKTKSH